MEGGRERGRFEGEGEAEAEGGGLDGERDGGWVLSSSLSSWALRFMLRRAPSVRTDRDLDRDREVEVDVDDGEAGTEGVSSRVLRRGFALVGEGMVDGDLGRNMKSWSCRRPLKLAGGGESVDASWSMRCSVISESGDSLTGYRAGWQGRYLVSGGAQNLEWSNL